MPTKKTTPTKKTVSRGFAHYNNPFLGQKVLVEGTAVSFTSEGLIGVKLLGATGASEVYVPNTSLWPSARENPSGVVSFDMAAMRTRTGEWIAAYVVNDSDPSRVMYMTADYTGRFLGKHPRVGVTIGTAEYLEGMAARGELNSHQSKHSATGSLIANSMGRESELQQILSFHSR